MGRPNQGNKAQTRVGYSHGTGVCTLGLLRGVEWIGTRPHAGTIDVGQGLWRTTGWVGLCVESHQLAWMATWGAQGWCNSVVNGGRRRSLGGEAEAGIMAWRGVRT